MFAIGLIFGYLLHLVEDSFSQAGINWLYPFTPYDEYVLTNYNKRVRKPDHFVNNKPIRHWWGKGYVTGGTFEKKLYLYLWCLFLINLTLFVS